MGDFEVDECGGGSGGDRMLREKAEVLAGIIYNNIWYATVILYLGALSTGSMGQD